MRLRTAALLLAALVVCTSLSVDAGQARRRAGVDPFDELMWTSIGESMGRAIDAAAKFAEARKNLADASKDIEAARQAFWAQYPDGPRRAETEAAFAEQLWAKDMFLLAMHVPDGCLSGNYNRRAEAMAMLMASALNLDGGVPSDAARQFCRWVDAIRAKASITNWTSVAMTLPEYPIYKRARDWAEYARAGKVPFGGWSDLADSTDPNVYARYLVRLNFPKDRETFPEELELLTEDFNYLASKVGREKLVDAAARILKAPKRRQNFARPQDPPKWEPDPMRVTDPAALGCRTPMIGECFAELIDLAKVLSAEPVPPAPPKPQPEPVTDEEAAKWTALERSGNPKDYALYLAWRMTEPSGGKTTANERQAIAERRVTEWIAMNGEEILLRVAESIRAAPKESSGDLSADAARRLGCGICSAGARLRASGPINGRLSGAPCGPSSCLHEILSLMARRRR